MSDLDQRRDWRDAEPHAMRLPRPGMWWACTAPERVPDDDVAYDLRCTGCLMAGVAAERSGHGSPVDPYNDDGALDGDRQAAESFATQALRLLSERRPS